MLGLFVIVPDGLGHFLVRLHNQSTHIIAFLAMIALAGISASLQLKFRAAADRTDLPDLLLLHTFII